MLFFFEQKTAYEMLRSLVGSEMCIRDRKMPGMGGAITGSSFTANSHALADIRLNMRVVHELSLIHI